MCDRAYTARVGSRVLARPREGASNADVQDHRRGRPVVTDIRLAVPDVKAGDKIPDGRAFLEVLDVRDGDEKPVLIVRSRHGPKNE
jgi:hypothetical protein